MSYAFNHFKVGEIKTVLFCFWASIKFHTQKFTLTVIFLSLFEILKKWASDVFQERILENEFARHFLKRHTKPAEMEYFHLQICSCRFRFLGKVENSFKHSLDLIPSTSPSVKIQIIGRKVFLRFKGKTLQYQDTFCFQKFVDNPAMFCLITSSKLSRQWFKFSLKVKMMGSNAGYLLKSFLLYVSKFA